MYRTVAHASECRIPASRRLPRCCEFHPKPERAPHTTPTSPPADRRGKSKPIPPLPNSTHLISSHPPKIHPQTALQRPNPLLKPVPSARLKPLIILQHAPLPPPNKQHIPLTPDSYHIPDNTALQTRRRGGGAQEEQCARYARGLQGAGGGGAERGAQACEEGGVGEGGGGALRRGRRGGGGGRRGLLWWWWGWSFWWVGGCGGLGWWVGGW
ncbi:hypothetical protein Q7P37_001231 [Cladosporium fusiforme]